MLLVVLPVYNGAKFIAKAIESVIAQTYTDWRLAVVDDCSTDNTVNIVKKYKDKRIKLYTLKRNVGTYQAINYALSKESGYSHFITHGADDISAQVRFELQMSMMQDNTVAVGIGYVRVDYDTGQIITEKSGGHSLFMYTKEVFDKLGYYDVNRYGCDSEYIARVRIVFKNRIKNLTLPLYYCYLHKDNISLLISEQSKERAAYVKKYEKEHRRSLHRDYIVLKDKITASIATIPSREEQLNKVVSVVLKQVDQLNVYLNEYKEVPKFLKHPKIKVYRSQATGDYGDAGKFWNIQKGYNFTIDDDIHYPNDYVDMMIAGVEKYERKAVVTLHGRSFFNRKIESYYNDSSNYYPCKKGLHKDCQIHFGGTGVMCFHSDTIHPKIKDFTEPNMADVWMGKLCAEKSIPIYILAHNEKYIREYRTETSIYRRFNGDDSMQTEIANSIKLPNLYKSEAINMKIDGMINVIIMEAYWKRNYIGKVGEGLYLEASTAKSLIEKGIVKIDPTLYKNKSERINMQVK